KRSIRRKTDGAGGLAVIAEGRPHLPRSAVEQLRLGGERADGQRLAVRPESDRGNAARLAMYPEKASRGRVPERHRAFILRLTRNNGQALAVGGAGRHARRRPYPLFGLPTRPH